MYKNILFFIMLIIDLSYVSAQPIAENKNRPLKVGAYYFDGWSGHNDKWALTSRLKSEFSKREPIWGWHDNSFKIMETQIEYAADNGLSFFSFCWYYPEEHKKKTPLNNALDLFLGAKNTNRMQFALMVANHKGFIIGPKDWDIVSNRWIKLFRERNYLKVDGHPILIFFSGEELLKAFGGAKKTRLALQSLKSEALAAKIEVPLIGVCATPGPENGWDDLLSFKNAGFDFLTGYNYHEYGVGKEKKQDFHQLEIVHEQIWNSFAEKDILPYIPVVTTGWDMRPWEKTEIPQSYYYQNRTPENVATFVQNAINWTENHPKQSLNDRLVILYAWNEIGEGGYLTPTKSEGDKILKALNKVVK